MKRIISKDTGSNLMVCGLVAAAIALVILMISSACARADAHGEATDPLWQRAERYMAQQVWVPGEVLVDEKLFNEDDELEEERRLVLGLTPHHDRTILARLLTAEENGADITPQARAEVDGPKTLVEVMGDSPFAATTAHPVRIWRNGVQRQIDRHTCIGFGYHHSASEATYEGIAWLDQETGLPVEMTVEVTSVPFKEEGINITAHMETIHFSLSADGDCYLTHKKAQTTISVWGFRGRVETLHQYRRHWRWPSNG